MTARETLVLVKDTVIQCFTGFAADGAANTTTDDAKRSELLKQAQTMIADDYVNAYLFQLAKTGVANAKIEGLWENAPMPANDLTGVSWKE